MSNDPRIAEARASGYRAAMKLADDMPPVAQLVFDTAERNVIRTLLCENLRGGEAQYWALVEQEVWHVELPSADPEATSR